MRLLHLLFAAAAAFSPAVQSQDDPQYLNWECPGMPCFIVNVRASRAPTCARSALTPSHPGRPQIFEYRPYSKLSQTCTFIDDHTMCTDLETGKSFDTGNSTVTQHHTVTRTHPCQDYWGCIRAGRRRKGTCTAPRGRPKPDALRPPPVQGPPALPGPGAPVFTFWRAQATSSSARRARSRSATRSATTCSCSRSTTRRATTTAARAPAASERRISRRARTLPLTCRVKLTSIGHR